MPYNIVPLETSSLTNAIEVFPEVSLMQNLSSLLAYFFCGCGEVILS